MKRLLCLWLCLPAVALAAVATLPGSDDERFIAAADAFRDGERVKLSRLAASLRGSELAPWADYWVLRQGFDDVGSDAAVHRFLDEQRGSYLAQKLNADWLKYLGKRGRWTEFAADYALQESPDGDLVCLSQQHRLDSAADASAEAAERAASRTLWFALDDIDGPCRALMEDLQRRGGLAEADVWRRLRTQFESKSLPQARQLFPFLPSAQRPTARQLDSIARRPLAYLQHLPERFAAGRRERELAYFALERLARLDAAAAAQQLQRIEAKLDEADRTYAWGQLAWAAAWAHRPEALSLYARAAAGSLSDEQMAWKARAALREGNWTALLEAIEQMTSAQAAQPVWIYWRGRALAAGQRADEAVEQFEKIATLPVFYGNLAAEELGRPIIVPPLAEPATTDELAAAAANPGLRRALALMRLNMRVEGVREWNWTVRHMDDRQLLAAAELARRVDVFDRSISTAERTAAEHDFTLRYPTPFRDTIDAKVHDLALDAGWVYALMRQESRFLVGAKSAAGARGLMQLMPTTARWVAKKIRLNGYRRSGVGDLDTNLTLGTNYLKLILAAFDDNAVLASAAYNAGPAHVRQWRGEQAMEGAVFIETIPFSETRNYVKNVMCNAVYYAALFEAKPQSLKARLGSVAPRKPGDTLLESPP